MFVNTANHGTLNLRAAPMKTSSVLVQIPYGTELATEKYNDDWMKVTYKRQTGYVMTQFLSSNNPAETSKITKADLKKVYDSLSTTLKLIEEILK